MSQTVLEQEDVLVVDETGFLKQGSIGETAAASPNAAPAEEVNRQN